MAAPLFDMNAAQLAKHIRAAKRAVPEDDEPVEPPFVVTVNGRVTRRRVGGPIALTARMARMVDLIVNGLVLDGSRVRCDPYEAGRLVGYQRRAVRRLAASPVFIAAYEAARAGGSTAHMVPTFGDVQRDVQHRTRDQEARERQPKPAPSKAATATGYVIRLPPASTDDAA